ncbi:hypothetical protein Agub_g7564 [Astrephomene gubernaculifera]|uniref:Uncharacterized protein n=1 Tax=Astrephomene gubernaculifera TaxID=47775 RepID=A0AAD3DSC1_9CHLO|nr:hypothetical protein Agub_g7564 [Astrephomene gubernaculifera]
MLLPTPPMLLHQQPFSAASLSSQAPLVPAGASTSAGGAIGGSTANTTAAAAAAAAAAGGSGVPRSGGQPPRPVLTQHLRCQLTQNQSMSGELQKALRRITPALQAHISALTFEIVEETYAEPARCATPLELSALPGLKSLTVLSGAEDALSHSKLDIVGATALETLVVFDVSCGCWCYKKPGHGIPPRLLSAPPACLRSLTIVGFVVNQCQNLHALSALTCLEELRLEQPDPDCLGAVAGELLLTWLPPSLRTLKLHAVVLPPCGGLMQWPCSPVPTGCGSSAAAAAPAAPQPPPSAAAPAAATLTAPPSIPGSIISSSGLSGSCPAAAASSSTHSNGAAELLYGVAPVAPLPRLQELYLSKCKVPALGVLGVCSQLTALGLINCLSCSGLLPAATALPALRSLSLIHTLSTEQEHGPSCSGGAVGGGLNTMPPAMYAAAAAAAPAPAATGGGQNGPWVAFPPHATTGAAGPAAAASQSTVLAPALHVPGLPLPAAVWGSDEQVAAAAACRSVTSLELILPRGAAGYPAVAALARMPCVRELDVALPCGLGECLMGLAALGRGLPGGGGGGRLRRLTLWVDARTCVNRNQARQLQAIQRSLQAHMPDTLVEWAGAESRHSSWTGLEARVFNPH